MIGLGAGLATLAATAGFASVGGGMLLAIAGVATAAFVLTLRPSALTFEPSGLRVELGRHARFFVPWTSIADVNQKGPAHHRQVSVRVIGAPALIAAATPDTPSSRGRVHTFFALGEPPGEAFSLGPWTAGLDSDTLARLLNAATGKGASLAN
jgi:hypothetical protein